jgi:subtilisin-like proprotein convertase family protein
MLSTFDGLDASGEWLLVITDDNPTNHGTLFNWALNFTY